MRGITFDERAMAASGAGAGAGDSAASAKLAVADDSGPDKNSRFISVKRQRQNIDYVEDLVAQRDAAADYLDSVVQRRCRGALSSWPVLNLVWGIMDRSLLSVDGSIDFIERVS